MSEFSKMIIESIMASKPVDTSKIFEEMIAERIGEVLPSVMHSMSESVLGPKDPNDEEEDFPEIDFDEMSDEDFAELLDNLSDEDLEDLADQLGDLDESELMEISKSTLGSYIKKAADSHGFHGAEVTYKTMKGQPFDKWKDNHKKMTNRLKGINKATDRLTKEEVELSEAGYAHPLSALKKSKPDSGISGGNHTSSNPDMRLNRRAGLDKNVDWSGDTKKKESIDKRVSSKMKDPSKYHEYLKKMNNNYKTRKLPEEVDMELENILDQMSDEEFETFILDTINDFDSQEEVNESLDYLDEISKGRLNTYLQKTDTENRPSPYNVRYMRNGPKKDFEKKRAEKRGKGISTALGKIYKMSKVNATEEVDLDEVSKDRLTTYIKKAAADGYGKTSKQLQADPKSMKRTDSLNLAIKKKFNTEEVELDEISKGRLKDYISAAKDSKNYHDLTSIRHANMVSDFKNPESKKNLTKSSLQHFGKVVKRSVGINKATNKLAKKDD